MGFEDMLVNFLLEPEDMLDLCNAIGEYRFQLTKLIVDNLHPDIILSHDDWGSKAVPVHQSGHMERIYQTTV